MVQTIENQQVKSSRLNSLKSKLTNFAKDKEVKKFAFNLLKEVSQAVVVITIANKVSKVINKH